MPGANPAPTCGRHGGVKVRLEGRLPRAPGQVFDKDGRALHVIGLRLGQPGQQLPSRAALLARASGRLAGARGLARGLARASGAGRGAGRGRRREDALWRPLEVQRDVLVALVCQSLEGAARILRGWGWGGGGGSSAVGDGGTSKARLERPWPFNMHS